MSQLKDTDSNQSFADLVELLTQRLQAGDMLDIEQIVAQHPEHQERLARLLPAMSAMFELGTTPAAKVAEIRQAAGSRTLGDYRILREIGRGGMGVVYEAEQISLCRKVALKVLPFAEVMDQRRLKRFQTEVRAAAQLHHSNIVPVHAVGSEHGLHFYAMQLIEGRSLAEVTNQLRHMLGMREEDQEAERAQDQNTSPLIVAFEGLCSKDSESAQSKLSSEHDPALRSDHSPHKLAYVQSIARLGIQAAEALDYAHRNGVLHRDIKPANLLLDGSGNLWITDFGLARIESDAGTTLTGDIVGTLRYMSPEQALAKRGIIDHRSDVYSLGVTLYEVLTLRPVFAGSDRADLLHQIAFDEPQRPRKWNPAIGRDLETIVLKAIEKNPADRYETAQELADDLRNFLTDRPIQARRASVVQQTYKWMRRHPSWVLSCLLALTVSVVALAVANVRVSRSLRMEALERAHAAASAKREAMARQEAEAQSRIAEENYQRTLDTVDSMLMEVATDRPEELNLDLNRTHRLLEQALRIYGDLYARNSTDDRALDQLAHAAMSIASITLELGHTQQAEQSTRRAIELYSTLEARVSSKLNEKEALAQLYAMMATIVSDKNDKLEWVRRSEQSYQDLIDRYPDYPGWRKDHICRLAELAVERGQALGTGPDARAAFAEAMATTQKILEEEEDHQKRGRLLRTQGNAKRSLALSMLEDDANADVQQLFEEAAADHENTVREWTTSGAERLLLLDYADLVRVLQTRGHLDTARQWCQKAIGLANDLVVKRPAITLYRSILADMYSRDAAILVAMGERQLADQAHAQSVSALDQIVQIHNSPAFIAQLASELDSWAILKGELADSRARDELSQQSLILKEELAAYPVFSGGWSFVIGGGFNEHMGGLCVDAAQDVIVHGGFSRVVDFDPGPNVLALKDSATRMQRDLFVAKYSKQGTIKWAKRFGSGDDAEVAREVIAGPNCTIHTLGYFSGEVDFGAHRLIGPPAGRRYEAPRDLFLAKLNPDGEVLWAHNWSNTTHIGSPKCAVDSRGNVYLGGSFISRLDCDPGPERHEYVSAGERDGYLIKLDPDGKYLWSMHIRGSGDTERVIGITTDRLDNCFVVGSFGSDSTFGDNNVTFHPLGKGKMDGFFMKLSPGGKVLWCKTILGSDDCSWRRIAIDSEGNFVLSGEFRGAVEIDGQAEVSSLAETDSVIAKLSPQCDVKWVTHVASQGDVMLRALAVNDQGITVLGKFNGITDFDPGRKYVRLLPRSTTVDYFVAHYGPDGDFDWVLRLGNPMTFGDIAVLDAEGAIYVSGQFTGTMFLPTGESYSSEFSDTFLLKLVPGPQTSHPMKPRD